MNGELQRRERADRLLGRRHRPGLRPPGGGRALQQHPADALRLRPGRPPRGVHPRDPDSDKVFGRVDFNLSPDHQLTLRHNYVKGVDRHLRDREQHDTLQLPRHPLPVQQQDQLDRRPAQQHVRQRAVQRAAPDLPADPRDPRPSSRDFPQVQVRLPDGSQPGRGHRAVLDRQRARPGHLRAHRRLHVHPRQPHLHRRHPQRVLQVQEPLHPRQVRHATGSAASTSSSRVWRSSSTTASRSPPTRCRRRSSA